MAESLEAQAVDFFQARESILSEIKKISKEIELNNFPNITLEKNEIKIDFSVPSLTKEVIFDSIVLIKSYIENVRIQTFEPTYCALQALNENFFDTKGVLDNIRFRFYATRNSNKVEISKKGNLTPSEILAIVGVYQLFINQGKRKLDPKELLKRLGIMVFDPLEEELKGNQYSFEQIAGYQKVKEEIYDLVIFPIQNPNMFEEVSKLTRKFPTENRPRAVLFEGDPGVGKTTMAKIVAFQCKIPLVYVPIESILSKYYGESSQNLAYVFDAASLFPSSIIFLDEIDSLAGSREDGMFEATRNLLSVLLRKLDGFEGKPNSITLGATNRKQDLDRALLSRFDKSIYFPLPNLEERAAIIGNYAIHLNELERLEISSHMEGFSGRNIKDFCDHVERKWASKLIQENLNPSPPPFLLYKETCTEFKK